MRERAICDAHGLCKIGQKSIKGEALRRDYRCAECGGMVEFIPVVEDFVTTCYEVVCHNCGEHSAHVIHCSQVRADELKSADIINGLPPELQALCRPEPTVSVKFSDLF